MKLTNYMLAILGLGLVTNATAGLSKEYTVNGVTYVHLTKVRLFAPCTTMTIKYVKGTPGTEEVDKASGQGVLGQVAAPAGTASSGVLVRPAKVNVNQGGGSLNGFIQGGDMNVTPLPAGGGNNGNGGNPHFN